jgi:hypothetical protein
MGSERQVAGIAAMTTTKTIRRRRARYGVLTLMAALILIPGTALTALRLLVPEMLDNLGDVNRIDESIALEEFEQVKLSAESLRQRAIAMRELDLATVKLDPELDALWDGFLLAQEAAADAVLAAAAKEDSRAVMASTPCGGHLTECPYSDAEPERTLIVLSVRYPDPPIKGRGACRCVRIRCRGGAVSGVDCRPMYRGTPLCAAVCRSLARKYWRFLGFGFFFEPEGESRAMSE